MLRKQLKQGIGNGLDIVVSKNTYINDKQIDVYVTHRGEFLQRLLTIYPDYDLVFSERAYNNENFIVKLFEDENYDSFTTNITIPRKDYRRRAPNKQGDYITEKITRESWTKTHTSPIFGTYKLTYKIVKVNNRSNIGFKVQIENSLNDNIYMTKDIKRSYADAEGWIEYLKDEIIDLNSDDLVNLID